MLWCCLWWKEVTECWDGMPKKSLSGERKDREGTIGSGEASKANTPAYPSLSCN